MGSLGACKYIYEAVHTVPIIYIHTINITIIVL